MIQQFLTCGKGLTDLAIYKSPCGGLLNFNLGLALMEVVPNVPAHAQYKMALGRLVNAKWSLRDLERMFGHDHRTLTRWGDALRSPDPAFVARMFAGRGPVPKVTEPVAKFAAARYKELRGTVRDYRRRIADEVLSVFGVPLSGESLRQVFRSAGIEESAGDGVEGLDKPLGEAGGAAVDESATAPSAPPSGPPAPVAAIEPAAPATPPARADTGSVEVSTDAARGCPAAVVPRSFPEVDPVPSSEPSAGASGCAPDPEPVSETTPPPRNQSPAPAPPSALPLSGRTPPSAPTMLHHAGQLLFAPWLDREEFGRPESLWLAQTLQGAVNIEQTKTVCPESLSLLSGGPPLGIRAQHAALARLADEPGLTARLAAANASILSDGPGRGMVFYYDPHTKEYTGELPFLKGWCGRIHGVAKVMHMDFMHTASGWPCLVAHYDNYYDLRDRLPSTLDMFDLLCPADRRRWRTIVIDRGIFGDDLFGVMDRREDHLVTWEKGYAKDGWVEGAPVVEFTMTRPRNRRNDLRVWRFRIQEAPWARRPGWRRIIVRATNPSGSTVEVSVLCSNPLMAAVEAVRLIFSRWLQENDFKNLDRHFGIMEMTSRKAESYAKAAAGLEDRPVESAALREARKSLRKAERSLGKLLFDRKMAAKALDGTRARAAADKGELDSIGAEAPEQAGDDHVRKITELKARLSKSRRGAATLERRIAKLDGDILKKESVMEESRRRFESADKEESRLGRAIKDGRCRPDTRRKAVLDNLKIYARNTFHHLLDIFRKHYDNRRDDMVILRLVSRSPGVVRRSAGGVHIGLWPKADLTDAARSAVKKLLAEMTERINQQFSGKASTVRIELLDAPPCL